MSSKIKFRRPTIDDVSILRKFFYNGNVNACDYSATNIFLWSEVNNIEISYDEEVLYIRYLLDGEFYYTFPITSKSIKWAVENIEEFADDNEFELKFAIVEEGMFEILEKIFPGKYKIEYNRDYFDYVYLRENLVNLSGRKYHGKKNHINKFKKNYETWSYESITNDNVDECTEMVNSWCMENGCAEIQSKLNEIQVVKKALQYFDILELKGGLIRAGNRIVAITMGEELNKDTFVVHFEKAFSSVQGAYPMINQQFVLNELESYKYVNREEDLGIEGLRKAKESYNPEFYVKKGIVCKI